MGTWRMRWAEGGGGQGGALSRPRREGSGGVRAGKFFFLGVHERLARLFLEEVDKDRFTYRGWERDLERLHGVSPAAFEQVRGEMIRRQVVHADRASAPALVALDAVALTYPGWASDKKAVESIFVLSPDLVPSLVENCRKRQARFDVFLAPPKNLALRRTDGSARPLGEAIAAFVARHGPFNYPGADGDVRKLCDKYGARGRGWTAPSVTLRSDVRVLRRRQFLFQATKAQRADRDLCASLEGRRPGGGGLGGDDGEEDAYHDDESFVFFSESPPAIPRLAALELSYPGWERHVDDVERDWCEGPWAARGRVDELEESEATYRAILKRGGLPWSPSSETYDLDFVVDLEVDRRGPFSYKAAARDDARLRRLVRDTGFSRLLPWLDLMARKEQLHAGDRAHPALKKLDALGPLTYPDAARDVARFYYWFVACPALCDIGGDASSHLGVIADRQRKHDRADLLFHVVLVAGPLGTRAARTVKAFLGPTDPAPNGASGPPSPTAAAAAAAASSSSSSSEYILPLYVAAFAADSSSFDGAMITSFPTLATTSSETTTHLGSDDAPPAFADPSSARYVKDMVGGLLQETAMQDAYYPE